MVNSLPQIGQTWTHFKGGKYVVTGFAWCAVGDALELRVLYAKVDSDANTIPFSRTLSNFMEPVNGCPRFDIGQ